MKCIRAHYSGKVQGVGFRWNAVQCSEGLNLSGYVKNLPDGRVELVVQGKESGVITFLNLIESSMKGYIHNVKKAEETEGKYGPFAVRR